MPPVAWNGGGRAGDRGCISRKGRVPPFREGCLEVPTGFGLGAALDRERVARYAGRFQRGGEFSVFGF